MPSGASASADMVGWQAKCSCHLFESGPGCMACVSWGVGRMAHNTNPVHRVCPQPSFLHPSLVILGLWLGTPVGGLD
jgi:hypothetical protein